MSNVEFVVNSIYKKAPLQKKKIENFLDKQDDIFFQEFEDFLSEYVQYLNKNDMTIEYCVDAYLKMVNNMFKSHVKFMRTGQYPTENAEDAFNEVYSNEKEMLSYMIGLALSQYLWSTHYEMFGHLKLSLAENKNNINKYLEIGPGHGLFLKNAIDILNKNTEMTAVDISQTSLNVSKSIITHFYPWKNLSFINKDMLDLNMDSEFDFIVMGEVIEHVEDPELLLIKISKLLSKNGRAFLSTCVNCPAIDHVYHFHTVDEIRSMFKNCGLIIDTENILPVEDAPMAEIINQKITINYSAIVKKNS
jgi:2-polyprenyl-3-methyl-5-hydroxy-6-metoxy-1,4-benzoquinol methylase